MFIFRKSWMLTFVLLGSLQFFCAGCQHLLYHPSSHMFVAPEQLKPVPEEVYVPVQSVKKTLTEPAEKIHAWFFKASPSVKSKQAIVVHFHGNGQNLSTHFAFGSWLTDYGFDYLIFDYRGYGKSDGEPSTQKSIQDGVSILSYAASQFPEKRLIVFGQSLGGNVALRSLFELQNKFTPELVIIEGSFLSYQQVGADALSRSWLTWPFQWASYVLLSDRWAAEPVVEKLEGPEFLVVHSREDEIIDFGRGQELFQRLAHPKTFIELTSGGHIEGFSMASKVNRENLIKFLEARGL